MQGLPCRTSGAHLRGRRQHTTVRECICCARVFEGKPSLRHAFKLRSQCAPLSRYKHAPCKRADAPLLAGKGVGHGLAQAHLQTGWHRGGRLETKRLGGDLMPLCFYAQCTHCCGRQPQAATHVSELGSEVTSEHDVAGLEHRKIEVGGG